LIAPAVIPATICRFRNRNTINGGMLMSKMLLDEHVVHIADRHARLDNVVAIAATGRCSTSILMSGLAASKSLSRRSRLMVAR
jgi:hypothetical protein